MKKNTVVGLKKPFEIAEDPLTELLRTGARRLIAEAVEAELQDFLEQFSEYRNQLNEVSVDQGFLQNVDPALSQRLIRSQRLL